MTSRRARTCRRSSTATAASPSPRRRCGRRRSPRGARPAGCTPSPGCVAAWRRARPGTTPAGATPSRTCSTTSTPPPTGSSGEGLAGRDRLAVLGRSNGGLLVGVALTQRPDLCRAVWCGVPLLDMIRFPEFLIARLWTSEYGDPDVAEEFAWLHAYSPYHHVVDGTAYPATLFTTAEGDSRVDPLHARKMAALRAVGVAEPGRAAGAAVPGGPRRSRRRQAGGQARRRARRRVDVPRLADRPASRRDLPRRVADRRRAGRAVGAARPGRHRRRRSRCSAPASASTTSLEPGLQALGAVRPRRRRHRHRRAGDAGGRRRRHRCSSSTRSVPSASTTSSSRPIRWSGRARRSRRRPARR